MVEGGLLGETQGVHQVGEEAVPVPGRGLVQHVPGNFKRKLIYYTKRNLLAGQFPWLVQSYVIWTPARVTY